MDEGSRTIDELSLPLVRPGSPGELAEVVRRAVSESRAVYPVGGGTQLGFGLPPSRPGVAVDLRGLADVIDYPARDMTITVQAGITIAALRRVLAAENQRLPIDVPRPEEATLGGAIAANTSGPRRFGAGTLRDYVIGITTMNDRALESKAGGRVVKNVAGYDLCKLHTGAFGTLGIITQVTLKVRPLPETSALVTFGCPSDRLVVLLDTLHASRTRPMCIDLLDARAAAEVRRRTGLSLPEQEWVLIVGFEDNELAVEWQLQQLLHELTAAGVKGVEATAGSATEPLWTALTESTSRSEAMLSLRAAMLPGRVAAWCRSVVGWGMSPMVHAHAGNGIAHVHYADLTVTEARDIITRSREESAPGGSVVLPRCPTAWKQNLRVWGEPRGDAWVSLEVKRRLDPAGLFNPGRMTG